MPKSKQQEVRKVKGRWQARVGYQGLRASQLCDTKEEAKRVKAQLRLKLIEKARRRTRVNEGPATLELLCDAYVADLEARGKAKDSIRGVKTTKKRLEWFFGQRMKEPLDLLTEAALFAFRAYYLEKGSRPSTINHDLLNIHTMLKLFAAGFPFPKRIFLPEDNTRVRYLEPDEKTRVMGFLQPPIREIAELAALTLMRLTEVRRLRREQVSLVKGIVVLPATKTGPDTVVLNTEAQRLLQAQLESHDSPWVFPNPRTSGPYSRSYISAKWREAARKAGLDDFHFHDLRHHGATMALTNNYSTQIVMRLGRWKSERVMRRYAAVTDETLRAAAEAVSGNKQSVRAA
jgi:integrase